MHDALRRSGFTLVPDAGAPAVTSPVDALASGRAVRVVSLH
ncbi:hypothetical protein [Streptomyces sp. OfavH-34-F]|nr:hypothetical protein [Streptomyces sp. OfavH-34-F]